MYPVSFNIKRQRNIARRSREDARQYTYRVIRDLILQLDLLPGQKLNENDFASLMDVSRTPIHDTLIRLSRENLVNIIPRRGAFVSRIDTGRIENAVWIIRRLDIAALNAIFVHKVSPDAFSPLYGIIEDMADLSCRDDTGMAAGFIKEFYHQIFLLAGDMELIWDSLQKTDIDLQRMLTLAMNDGAFLNGTLTELRAVADALAARDNDSVSSIFNAQMSRILQMIPLMKEKNPDCFI